MTKRCSGECDPARPKASTVDIGIASNDASQDLSVAVYKMLSASPCRQKRRAGDSRRVFASLHQGTAVSTGLRPHASPPYALPLESTSSGKDERSKWVTKGVEREALTLTSPQLGAYMDGKYMCVPAYLTPLVTEVCVATGCLEKRSRQCHPVGALLRQLLIPHTFDMEQIQLISLVPVEGEESVSPKREPEVEQGFKINVQRGVFEVDAMSCPVSHACTSRTRNKHILVGPVFFSSFLRRRLTRRSLYSRLARCVPQRVQARVPNGDEMVRFSWLGCRLLLLVASTLTLCRKPTGGVRFSLSNRSRLLTRTAEATALLPSAFYPEAPRRGADKCGIRRRQGQRWVVWTVGRRAVKQRIQLQMHHGKTRAARGTAELKLPELREMSLQK